MTLWTRRQVLGAAAATGGAVLLPLRVGIAQDRATALLRAPKQALVIGNSSYKGAPLKNPSNDARGMAEALKAIGFDIALGLDLGQAAMSELIRAYVERLAKTKAVGLFYFAGHGTQLAWRNYVVPADADIDNVEAIRERCIDINTLIAGIRKAGNPMNVIILDACRDNPFGRQVQPDQKGLSQLDAPPGTFLAYATAPGNTAIDGEGDNGLYTGHLLREIKVPEAKIEDVFKRVRLSVRRASNGLQIPWESTSLEEDFYFVPPRALAVLALEEAERERKLELALLEKRRAEDEAERKLKREQALQEAKRAAGEAERKRQQELAALEQQRVAEEAERKRKQELALKEAQRVAEETERKRREEQALSVARLADEEAARKHQLELALREKQRAEQEAERKRKEEQALSVAKLAEEEAGRKYKQELALREKQHAQQEVERQRAQQAAFIKKPNAAFVERQFEEELAIWEKIKASNEPELLEDYLRRYPSGRFSELAQFQLDRVLARQGEKKIQVVSSADNPYSKGTAVADTNRKVGDSYTYRVTDLFTKLQIQTVTETITQIADNEVIYDSGRITDLLGNVLRQRNGERYTVSQIWGVDYAVGKRWTTRSTDTTTRGAVVQTELERKVVAREKITIAAGVFNAFVIESNGWSGNSTQIQNKIWIAPDRVRAYLAIERLRRRGVNIVLSEREELVSYRQS